MSVNAVNGLLRSAACSFFSVHFQHLSMFACSKESRTMGLQTELYLLSTLSCISGSIFVCNCVECSEGEGAVTSSMSI